MPGCGEEGEGFEFVAPVGHEVLRRLGGGGGGRGARAGVVLGAAGGEFVGVGFFEETRMGGVGVGGVFPFFERIATLLLGSHGLGGI